MAEINYDITIDDRDQYVIELNEQGPQGARGYTGQAGADGVGINRIHKTSTSGLVDTYTIEYTNGNTTTFDITNGNGIASIALTSTLGLTDTYTITFDNGNTTTFDVENGKGISSITGPVTVDNVDTYTINYNDNTTSTFTVTNGISPTATVTKVGNVATITITDKDGTTTANVYDGTGSVADVLVNGASVLDGQDAKILIKTINSNSITGSGNLDVGTVTSVNNVNPVGGDVTLTASDIGALSDNTKYGADLSYSSNNLQLLDQDGNNLGNSVTIQSSPDIDGITITKNLDDELQTVAVIDQNNTSNGIKTWTGTKAQYDAIVTKDANTLYNITDDTDVTLSLLELLYPVGSIYIGTMLTCPLQTLGVGTWQLVASDRVLQGAGTRGSVGTTVNESLPNITGSDGSAVLSGVIMWGQTTQGDGAIKLTATNTNTAPTGGDSNFSRANLSFDASLSSSTYQDDAPVQQDAYLVNIWERIS